MMNLTLYPLQNRSSDLANLLRNALSRICLCVSFYSGNQGPHVGRGKFRQYASILLTLYWLVIRLMKCTELASNLGTQPISSLILVKKLAANIRKNTRKRGSLRVLLLSSSLKTFCNTFPSTSTSFTKLQRNCMLDSGRHSRVCRMHYLCICSRFFKS